MPGRVAARSAQAATKSRGSTRTTSPNTNIPDEGETTSLREEICAVFAQAQRYVNGSRKLIITLRKIQEACCYEPVKPRKGPTSEDYDENDFAGEVLRCVVRVLQIKKSEPTGDRLVRFLAQFLKHAAEADNAIFQSEDPNAAFPETPSSRLSSFIIARTLPLLTTKDKVVRFRCTQVVAHLVNTLESIDDELFHPIRLGLLKRLRDKESPVRAQAVYGLGRLASEMSEAENDEDSDDDGVAGSVLEKLLDVLQNDPSADVRRSLLLNLPFTPATLPYLLERARDSDAPIRRALYARLLPALADFRHLSLTHREKLLRWGLRDRDDNVKKATARLFRERWIGDCVQPRDEEEQSADQAVAQAPSLEGLLELLERIDVVNSGNDGGIALDAMKAFWEGRPDYCQFVTFDEAYWKDMTPEGVFIARTFNDFCHSSGSSAALQEKMPEVTRFAFLLQENINRLVEAVRQAALQQETEEDSAQQEFIVEQLLNIALTLDYSDEIGRRTMFSLLREALALAELPEEATRLVTDVLRTTCGTLNSSEKEFIAVVLEAIAEVHDTIMGEDASKGQDDADDSFHSAQSELSDRSTPRPKPAAGETMSEEERVVREIMVNMKCLHIAQCMLQNVECDLDKNSDLVTMLNNLVIPAVRSQEAPIRERGLLCLGLCCLLDKNLAEENLTLFLHCFSKGHEALQNIAIQIIGDILTAQPLLLLDSTKLTVKQEADEPADSSEQHPLRKPIHKLFTKALNSPIPLIQTTACTALCKLMLSSPPTMTDKTSILDHDELLRMLVICYFNPETATNSALRQALTYFVPVYCHSRKENLQRMGRVASDVLQWCIDAKDEMEVDGEAEAAGEMVGLTVVTAHLVDWTDGRKLAAALSGFGENNSGEKDDGQVHIDMAREVLEKVLSVTSKDERKLFISMLGKLEISDRADSDQLQVVATLISEVIEEKVAVDATTRNTLVKVQTAVTKALSGGDGSKSVAPSVVGDDDAQTVVDDGATDAGDTVMEDASVAGDESQLPMPVPSPRKPRRTKSTAPSESRMRRPRKQSVQEEEPYVKKERESSAAGVQEGVSVLGVKEEAADDENTPRPQQRIVKLAESTIIKLEESTLDHVNAPSEISEEPEVAAKPEPVKRRGRPPKNATQPPARKSVRSGRRKAASTAPDAVDAEDQS